MTVACYDSACIRLRQITGRDEYDAQNKIPFRKITAEVLKNVVDEKIEE